MTTASAEIIGERIFATYHGGAYIDLHFDSPASPAFEVINVWDYEKDVPTIENTSRWVLRELKEWGASIDRHDIRNYRESVAR